MKQSIDLLQKQISYHKKAIGMYVVLGVLLFFILGSIFTAGSDHVQVVEEVITLQEKNEMLTQTNETLYTEVVKLRIVVDTLTVFKDSLLETSALSQIQNTNNNDYEKTNVTNSSVYANEPYSFSVPIEIETEETEVSDSPN